MKIKGWEGENLNGSQNDVSEKREDAINSCGTDLILDQNNVRILEDMMREEELIFPNEYIEIDYGFEQILKFKFVKADGTRTPSWCHAKFDFKNGWELDDHGWRLMKAYMLGQCGVEYDVCLHEKFCKFVESI